MSTIGDVMTRLHRDCDNHFAQAEAAFSRREWQSGSDHFASFRDAMGRHFGIEETLLFPAFEEETGGEMGPTRVMAMEHIRVRDLLDAIAEAMELQDAATCLDLSETLSIMLQQHNMKEENALYPMIDQVLAAQAESLRAEIEDLLNEP